MTTTNNDKSVDHARHGSGNRNADHGTGRDKQRQQRGIQKTPVPPKETPPGASRREPPATIEALRLPLPVSNFLAESRSGRGVARIEA